MFLQFSCIFLPKNLPKTLPKRRPNPSKIDVKNVLFFNIDFFGFWTRFWSLLDLQLGAKLAILASKTIMRALLSLLELDVFKKWRLECSGLDFGGPGLRFWRFWASILKGFGTPKLPQDGPKGSKFPANAV